jgi:hypothetical protein
MASERRHRTAQFRHAAIAALLLVFCAPQGRAEDFYAGK